MANLNKEFEAGRLARIERQAVDACPYMATSDCADAWLAGYAYEASNLPHRMTAESITHGRGYRVNVMGRDCTKAGLPKCKAVFMVDYPRNTAPSARLIEG